MVCRKIFGGPKRVKSGVDDKLTYKTLNKVIERTKHLRTKLSGSYDVSPIFKWDSEDYYNYDILDSIQERHTRIFRHMIDHLWLIIYPFASGDKGKVKQLFNNYY